MSGQQQGWGCEIDHWSVERVLSNMLIIGYKCDRRLHTLRGDLCRLPAPKQSFESPLVWIDQVVSIAVAFTLTKHTL